MSGFEELARRTSDGLGSKLDASRSATVPRDALADATMLKKRAATRSRELLDAVARLDTQTDQTSIRQLMDWIREQYDARGGGQLIGLFSRCYLGHPYIDHVMTVTGQICEHFTAADSPPPGYQSARPLAANSAYVFVEVYADGGLVPIRSDGRPVL